MFVLIITNIIQKISYLYFVENNLKMPNQIKLGLLNTTWAYARA